MKTLLIGLQKVAEIVADEKPDLHFFALVHPVDGLWDHWDLLVSSDQLQPWSMEARTYIDDYLRKKLSSEDLVKISRIVALPPDNKIIRSLIDDEQIDLGKLVPLSHDANFDEVCVLWPKKGSKHAAPA